MSDLLFYCAYFGGASVVIAGGALMAISPEKFISSLARIGRLTPEGRRWLPRASPVQSRLAGVVIAAVGIAAVAFPISWMRDIKSQTHPVPTPVPTMQPHFDAILFAALVVFVLLGTLLILKPETIRWWLRKGAEPSQAMMPIYRRGMIFVRVFGAIFVVFALIGIVTLLTH